MKIDVPQIDWLTFTTWQDADYRAWQGWQNQQPGELKAGKIRMYEGLWRGNSFIGEGRQGEKSHGLIRVSGGESHDAFYKISSCGYAKCTRLDVQVTTPLPLGYSARQFADDVRAGQGEQFKRAVKLIENDDEFNTVYIGSGSSDRFARCYVKLVEDVYYLRFEVQFKADWADAIAKQIQLDDAVLAGVLLDFIDSVGVDDSQGVMRMFTNLLEGVRAGIKLGYDVRDKNKTLEWILEQVTPAMIRLLADHDTGNYLANHLNSLVERYFNDEN